MTAAALTLLAAMVVVAAAGRIPVLRGPWGVSVISVPVTGLLAAAALCARAAGPVSGAAQAAAYVLVVLAAALCADPVVRAVFTVGIVRRRSRAATEGPGAETGSGPLRGGLTIGVLERTAVAVSVLAGWPGGIAVVMAVKGLARYPELREPDAAEQFIIGTFTSVLFSLAVAGVGFLLLR